MYTFILILVISTSTDYDAGITSLKIEGYKDKFECQKAGQLIKKEYEADKFDAHRVAFSCIQDPVIRTNRKLK